MTRRIAGIMMVALLLLLSVEVPNVYASRRGGRHFSGDGRKSSGSLISRRGDFDHKRGFVNRRFHKRNHVVIVTPLFHRHYHPYAAYSYDSGYYKSEYKGDSLSILAIVDMAERGLPDDVIIEEIRRTRSTFNLTAETITYLRQHNVSNRVIDYMVSARRY